MMIAESGLMAAVGVAAGLAVIVLVLSVALVKIAKDSRKNDSMMKELLGDAEAPVGTPTRVTPFRSPNVQSEVVQPKQECTSWAEDVAENLNSFWRGGPVRVDPEDEATQGRVNFALSYEKDTEALSVHVVGAEGLPALDMCGSSDPYVRAWLFPDPNCPVKLTRVHRRTLSPRFNQTILFPGYSTAKLEELNLCMQVMDYDRFSRDDPIGEILLPLKSIKLDNSPMYWKNLGKPVAKDSIGEILISLCYMPQKGKLTVVIIRAKDLPAKDITGTSDPYVKLWLIEQGTKVEKRKTSIKPHNLQPNFNESFTFNVAPEKVEEDLQLAITVMDYDILSSNDEMGHVILGRKGTESGQKHWKEMFSRQSNPVMMWHRLSPKW